MTLQSICAASSRPSSFLSAARGSASWYHEANNTVSLVTWQGRSVVRQLQHELGVTVDGIWGVETNEALRRRMRTMGMDFSGVRDGAITARTLENALAVMYTLSTVGPQATSVAVRICLPPRTVLPRWRAAPPDDQNAAASSDVVESNGVPETPAPIQRWRRPAGSEVVYAGLYDENDNHFVTYRLASGEVRHATLNPDGELVSDRLATPTEAAGPAASSATPMPDPGTRAPGETAAPPVTPDPRAPDVRGYDAPPAPGIVVSPLMIAAAVAMVAAVGVVAFVAWPSPPPPPLPVPLPPPPAGRTRR